MTDEQHNIEVVVDSTGAESGADRSVRSIENIRNAANRASSDVSRGNERQSQSYKKASAAADQSSRSMDNIRAKARRAGRSGKEAGDQISTAFDRSRSKAEAAAAGLTTAARATDRASNSAGRADRQFNKMNDELTKTGRLANQVGGLLLRYFGTAAVATAIGQSVRASVDFSSALAEVSTLVDTTVVSIDDLSRASLESAIAFSSTPVEQASAFYQIISAGASNAAEATDILTASNRLAVGGVTDVRTAADGLTSILNAYGIEAQNSEQVTDALFVTVKAGKTTVDELSNSIGKVAPLAAQANVELEELLAAVAALTKGGISTNESITGVRAVLASIVKPTKEASDLAAQLGIEFNAAGLEALGLKGFMDQLINATDGNTAQLAQLFGGVEALVPVLALAGQAGTDFSAVLDDMATRGGATEEAFNKIADSPGFKLGQLMAVITSAAIALGDALATILIPLITTVVGNFDLLSGAAIAAGVAFGIFTLASKAASGQLGIMAATIATTTKQFGVFAGAQVAAAGATAAFGSVVSSLVAPLRAVAIALAANPIGALIAGLGLAITLLVQFRDEIKVTEGGLATLSDTSSVVWDDVTKDLEGVTTYFKESWDDAISFLREMFGPIVDVAARAFGDIELSIGGVLRFSARVVDRMIGLYVGAFRAIVAAWDNFPSALKRIGALAINGLISIIESGLNAVASRINGFLDVIGVDTFSPVKIQRLEVGASNMGSAVGKAFVSGFEFSAAEDRVNSVLDRAEQRAAQRAAQSEQSAAKAVASAGEVSSAQTSVAEATDKASGATGKAAKATRDLSDSNKSLEGDLERLTARYDPLTKAAQDYAKELETIQKLQDAGLINQGQASNFRQGAAETFDDAKFDVFLDQFDKAFEDSQKKREFAENLAEDARKAAEEFERRGIEAGFAIADAIGGKVGGIFGDVVGVFEGLKTGNFGGVRGPLGGLLSVFAEGRDGDKSGSVAEGIFGVPGSRGKSPFFDAFAESTEGVFKDLTRDLDGLFKGVFGENGLFGKNLGSILGKAGAGAAIGSAINPIVDAIGLPSSGTGAQIGGAIGSFVPIPGGEILGSIAGSILGGLFGGSKRGSAIVTGVDNQLGTFGDSSSRIDEALGLGGSVQEGLKRISDELGVAVGAFKVSIGIRNDDIRVDPQGRGFTKTSKFKDIRDFGSDAEGAIEFAIQNAIADGAITLDDPASNRVLRNSNNLDQAVSAISLFRDVKSQLEELDGSALSVFTQIKNNFEDVRSTLISAGFAASELSDLEELYARQREQALEQATEGFGNLIDEITNGANSGKTVLQRFEDAQSNFNAFRTDIQAGRTVNQDEFTSAGQEAFNLARQVFGSATPEFEAFKADLVELTRQARDNVETQAGELAPVVEEIKNGNQQSSDQNQEVIDLLAQIREDIRNGGGNPFGYLAPGIGTPQRLAF